MADLDPTIDDPLDTFSLVLPLPYRLATVVVLGVWLWGLNLHGLSKVKLVSLLRKYQSEGVRKISIMSLTRAIKQDTSSLIRYQADYHAVYRFAAILSAPLVPSLLLYWTITRGTHQDLYDILPNVTLGLILLAFILPSQWTWPKQLRPHMGPLRLQTHLKRCLVGGLARTEDGKFGDVLLADALTSYAKPISEFYVFVYMLATRQSTTGAIDRGSKWIVPVILA